MKHLEHTKTGDSLGMEMVQKDIDMQKGNNYGETQENFNKYGKIQKNITPSA